jgi:chromosome segregation ATPase
MRNPDFDAVMIKKTELERLKAKIERLEADYEIVVKYRNELSRNLTDAQTEIERLKGALQYLEQIAAHNEVLFPKKVAEFCRRALEQKE